MPHHVYVYTKKPVEIEAIQLRATNIFQVVAFMEGKAPDIRTQHAGDKWDDYKNMIIENGGIDIPTLEGVMRASFTDFIIKGIQGEFYPCKPDIFRLTYDIKDPCDTPIRESEKD